MSDKERPPDGTEVLLALAKKYEQQPVLRMMVGVASLATGGLVGLAETGALSLAQRVKAKRAVIYIEEVGEEVDPRLVDSEEFVHCVDLGLRAAMRSDREEKIRAFARLLKAAAREENLRRIDDYEEAVGVLDDLSWREWLILKTLDKYETAPATSDFDTGYAKHSRFWGDFKAEIVRDLGVPEDEFDDAMHRLTRSACFKLFGFYAEREGQPSPGKLTPLYHRLCRIIEDESNDTSN